MSEAASAPHPLETLLRLCVQAAPKPWHPRVYAREAGVPEAVLHPPLELLWLEGLVQKAEGTPETGPGLTATPDGVAVLADPEALRRLGDGRALFPDRRGCVVREADRRPPRPTVTYGLMAVSVAAFVYGLFTASANGSSMEAFFWGNQPGGAFAVVEKLGAMLNGADWVNGQWWRLFTSCFIHIGVLNLLIALYFLFRVGARAEQMWGAARFLILYLTAAVGGNLVALALSPTLMPPGGWGGVYGLMGAEAVWVLCNERCLPRAVAGRMRSQVAVDAILVAMCVLIPWLNRWEELGGALTAVAVGLVLQVQRFGPSPGRWLVLAVLPALAWMGFAFLNHERATNPEWGPINRGQANVFAAPPPDLKALEEEAKAFDAEFGKRVEDEANNAYGIYVNKGGVLDLAPNDRQPAAVERVKHSLAEQRDVIKQLEVDLAKAGPDNGEKTENRRQAALRLAAALDDLLTTAEKRLREGEEWTREDEVKAGAVKTAYGAWKDLPKQ